MGFFFFLLLFCVTCRVLSKKTNFVCVCASVCLTVLLLFFFFCCCCCYCLFLLWSYRIGCFFTGLTVSLLRVYERVLVW